MSFCTQTAKRAARKYGGSYHELWKDEQGSAMLACKSNRTPGVSVNWTALQRFRNEGGEYVGLKNPDFNVIIPLSKLDGIEPYPGDDYIVVRRGDVGVPEPDDAPCDYGDDNDRYF